MSQHVLSIIAEQAEQAADGDRQGELSQHMLAHLICTRRHTITGLLNMLGRGRLDWTKAYRLYREHVDGAAIFSPILDGVLDLLSKGSALVLAVDDSYLRKTGKKVSAAGWYRDPLGPAFHTNIIWAQRFVQISAAVADPSNPKRSRMIPIAVELIPKLPKPEKNASKEVWANYEQIKALNSPGAHAVRLLQQVREHLDKAGHRKTSIRFCGDGDYSNSSLLPSLPPRTVYIGRTRSDIHLCAVVSQPGSRKVGRPNSYGEALPTPHALYKDRSIPWEELSICNGPNMTKVRYKHIAQAKWHVAGERALVKVVVIAPLRYKRRKNGPWKYTQPAYLVCTDPDMSVEQLIQCYFWRWGIEVNFKEEKQLFGAGHAQVRNAQSASSAPVVCIATYAALLLAGIRAYGFHSRPPSVEPPKWYTRKRHARVSASDLSRQLHQELMLKAAGNFSPLAFNCISDASGQKLPSGFAA